METGRDASTVLFRWISLAGYTGGSTPSPADQPHRLEQSLRYQHVVKGIVVISRKSCQHFGMRTEKREFQKTAFFSSRTKNWQLGIQLTYPCLYSDFPPRHSTDERYHSLPQAAPPSQVRCVGSWSALRATHWYPATAACQFPSNVARMSGGRGASKSSGIVSFPSKIPRRFFGIALVTGVRAASAWP